MDEVPFLPEVYGGRVGRLRAHIRPECKILEIGASYKPVAPRSAGYNTFTVDHASREELLAKYAVHVKDPQIEHVDFVCHDGNLAKVIGVEHHGTFDICIASHVIEHMVNPITLLQNVEKLLRPAGVFTMAIPDKRGCFDFFRSLTGTGDWLDAFERNAHLHSRLHRFDFEAYTVGHNGVIGWNPGPLSHFQFSSKGLKQAWEIMKAVGEGKTGDYYDIHAWTFVPSSFALIIFELHALNLIQFAPTDLHTAGWEFFVDLRKDDRPAISDYDRMKLLKRIAREQAQGFNQLVD
ncbi:MAG: methyltransferase domain-containing protein [Steroidobacteraceae bacterium]